MNLLLVLVKFNQKRYDFIETVEKCPDVTFVWVGGTPLKVSQLSIRNFKKQKSPKI